MRSACILLTFVLAAGAQSIPESDAARARHLLASPSWQDKAWGVYFAGRLNSDDLTDSLLDAFRGASPLRDARPVSEEYGYVAALFDAAIQSGITVPAELLEPFEEKWRAPVVILLARDPASEESLLRLRAGKLGDGEWLAVSNLLLALKSQRFFAEALSEVNISHVFTLADPGETPGNGSGSSRGTAFTDGLALMPRDFPPVGVYVLLAWEQKGDVMLAPGPQNASYYRRTIAPTNQRMPYSASPGFVDRRNLAVEYLAPLAKMTDVQAAYVFRQQTLIEFRSDDDLRRQWDAALTAQEAAIRAFVRTAQEHGLGSVTGMMLKIVPKVYDDRKTTAGPTPPLTSREFVLE
jgi:hypothetical protein